MDKDGIISEGYILALSWNIATNPKLYRKLALNPYSPVALQIISETFPLVNTADVIRAVILAEPEGQLLKEEQTSEIIRRLNTFYNKNALKFTKFSEDLIYDILFKTAFETNDFREAEQKYSQNQRKNIKLLILSLIRESRNLRIRVKQENLMVFLKDAPKTQFVIQKSQKTFLRVALAVIFLIPLLLLTLFPDKSDFVVNAANKIIRGESQNTILSQKTGEQELSVNNQRISSRVPVRLVIPSINVDATVEDVGVTSGGAMEVPANTVDVGWYQPGVSPGETGSAVISGHFDGETGKSGVFNNLNILKSGDKIYVINDQGVTNIFVVRESKTYDPGYADEVFFSNDGGIHLNLVTCNGVWDKNKKSYSKRLVVFADLLRE